MTKSKSKATLLKTTLVIITFLLLLIIPIIIKIILNNNVRNNNARYYPPTEKMVVIACENEKLSQSMQELTDGGTVFKYWLFDLDKHINHGKKLLCSNTLPFRKCDDQGTQFHQPWINLLQNGERFAFFNKTNKGWFYFEIKYDPNSEQIHIDNIKQIKGYFDEDYIIAIDSDQRKIVDSSGVFTKIDYNPIEKITGRSINDADYSVIGYYKINNILGLRSICYADNKLMLIQKEVPNNNKQENSLSCRNLKTGREQTIKFGLDPYQDHDIYYFSPIDINEDRDKVIFLSKHINNNEKEQWLCVWDLKTNKAKAITKLEDPLLMTPRTLLWRPGKDSHEVALCVYNRIILIDTSTGQIFQRISPTFRLIRWSPDGSKLGMMDYKGMLYYYEMNTKKLIKVDENPDNFNFFWVE